VRAKEGIEDMKSADRISKSGRQQRDEREQKRKRFQKLIVTIGKTNAGKAKAGGGESRLTESRAKRKITDLDSHRGGRSGGELHHTRSGTVKTQEKGAQRGLLNDCRRGLKLDPSGR